MGAADWASWNRETYARVGVEPLSRRYQPKFDHEHRVSIVSLFSIDNLGARAVFAFMKEAGFDVDLVLFKESSHNNFKMPTARECRLLLDLLRERDVKTVGLSVRSGYVKLCAKLTRDIHERLGIPVVWGGTAATVTPEQCIQEAADYAVWNQGEETFAELVNALATTNDLSSIQGLWHRSTSGDPVANAPRPTMNKLDALPLQDLENENKFWLDFGKLKPGEPLRKRVRFETMAARGCPYSCSFCIHSTLNPKVKPDGLMHFRSPEHVIREVEYARSRMPKLGYIYWADEVFGARLDWLRVFSREYTTRGAVPFFCQLEPRAVTEERLRLLERAGMAEINIGIQSGSERTRRNLYAKPVSDEKLLAAVRRIARCKVLPRYDIIADNPNESNEDRRATLNLLLEIPRPFVLNIFSLLYLPGTTLTAQALDEGAIRTDQVSGLQPVEQEKSLHQFAMSFDYPRSREEQCWCALFSLTSKRFIPKRMIRRLAEIAWLKRYPYPLVLFARAANLIRLGDYTIRLLLKRRISLHYVRRFLGSLNATTR